jgi:SET domain
MTEMLQIQRLFRLPYKIPFLHPFTMMKSRSMNVCICIVAFWSVISLNLSVNAVEVDEECRLFLAPSYLAQEGKPPIFGLFAGAQGFQKGEIIPSEDIAVPVFDFLKSPVRERSELHKRVLEFLEGNFWVADYIGSKFESNHSVSAFVPGVGSLTNYHSGIANVDWHQSSLLLREPDATVLSQTGLAHPSRGAISPYYNATFQATMWIPPGMEMFADYGATEDAKEISIYHDTVTRWDYNKADLILDRMIEFMDRFNSSMSESLQQDVVDFMLDTVLQGADGKHAKIIRSLIPAHPKKLHKVKEAGGTFAYRNKDVRKSMEWLKTHGLCVDNLKAGHSTIPDAGRGAFARRAIAEGTVISPVPMLPILQEEVMEQFSITKEEVSSNNKTKVVFDAEAPATGYHLLLNYAFGHPESTLMLLPMAPIVNYINHAPKSEQINAYLRWAKHDYVINEHDVHDYEVEKIRMKNQRKVTMELVAFRDIAEDEEILIDYGDDWAASWDEFKSQWSVLYKEGEKWPLKAIDLRSLYKENPFPVDILQGQTPYSPGVVTGCFVEGVDDLPDGLPRQNARGQQIMRFLAPRSPKGVSGQYLSICDLHNRTEVVDPVTGQKSYNYTVVSRKEANSEYLVEIREVPHWAVTLLDMAYTGDIHTPGAFRRWINIGDQRFPQAWRNARL